MAAEDQVSTSLYSVVKMDLKRNHIGYGSRRQVCIVDTLRKDTGSWVICAFANRPRPSFASAVPSPSLPQLLLKFEVETCGHNEYAGLTWCLGEDQSFKSPLAG